MIFETTAKFFDADSGTMVDYFGNEKMFRLCDVRAPDKNEPGYNKAKKVVIGMAGRYNNIVTVEVNNGMDAYNRLLVLMYNPDGSINERMIQRGYR